MERKFAIRGILENKKRFAMTFLVMLLAAFLLQFCSVLRSSLNKSIVEDRFDTYGSFTHYTEEAIGFTIVKKAIQKSEAIERVGTMTAVGYFDEYKFGYIDPNAAEMGRVRVTEGRMPENVNEIALEPSFLKKNGYTTELGQTIHLSITCYKDPEDEAAAKVAEVEYILCGLLNDYTNLWGFGFSGLIYSDNSEEAAEHIKELYGSVRQYTYLFDAKEHPNISGTRKNLNAYPRESLLNVTTLLGYAIWMIVAVSAAVLLVCTIFSVLKRSETWRFFRDLGATKGQIQRIVLWEGFFLGVPALILGSFLGVMISIFVLLVVPSPVGDRWRIAVVFSDVLKMSTFSFGAVFVGITVPSFIVRGVSLLPGDKRTAEKKYRRSNGIGFLSVPRLVTERMRAQRGVTFLLTGLLFSCGLCSMIVVNMVSGQIGEIRRNDILAQNGELIVDRNYDRIDGMYDFFSLTDRNITPYFKREYKLVEDETIEQIESIYGVEKVNKFMVKSSDYNLFDPYLFLARNRDAKYIYCSNAALEEFGGESALLYMDLSAYDDTEYFDAYITGEKARAAYMLAYCEEFSHGVGDYFGKAMTYSQTLDMVPQHYYLHMTEGKVPTEAELNEYYSKYHVVQWGEFIADTENCNATVWGINGEEVESILQSAEGEINLTAYEQGEECVLVLPDIYFMPQEIDPEPNYPPVDMHHHLMEWQYLYQRRTIGFYDELKNTLFSDNARMQGYEIFSENLIQVGDVIPVKYLDETVEIKVGAILRELPDEASGYPYSSIRPYTIITGESFFDRIGSFTSSDAYECVTIKLNGKQPSSLVEVEIKQIMADTGNCAYITSNLDANRQGMEQAAWVSISTLLLFAVLYFAVALVVLSIIFSISMESQRRRIAVLRALGMEVKKIQLSYLIESLLYSVIGFVGAVPVMLTVWGIVQYKTFGSGGPWLSYIVSNGCLNFMWWAYGLVFLAVTVGVLCTLYLPLQKFFKDNIIEQLQS